MICPLKFNILNSKEVTSVILKDKNNFSDTDEVLKMRSKVLECEKEKCAWWSKSSTKLTEKDEDGNIIDQSIVKDCAIRVLAEK